MSIAYRRRKKTIKKFKKTYPQTWAKEYRDFVIDKWNQDYPFMGSLESLIQASKENIELNGDELFKALKNL